MTGIHLIILKDGIYKVKEPGHDIDPMFDFFDACDIFRNALATYQDEINRLQAEYDANQYARDRAVAYPALAEQFDKLYHDINNGTLDETGEFFTALKTVKDDNPKPSE